MLLSLLFALNVHAACQWNAQDVGELSSRELPEASGAVFSRAIPDRLYHINDSGNEPIVYWTDINGRLQGSTEIDVNVSDVEDLGYGPCGNQNCLYLADIGDNSYHRRKIRIVLVEESRLSSSKQRPRLVKDVSYPDGQFNAESLSVHPRTGDVFIMTKDTRNNEGRSRLYRLKASEVMTPGETVLEPWGMLDLGPLADHKNGKLATGMAFHPSGNKLYVLTYRSAVIIDTDLASPLRSSQGAQVIQTVETHQQEAIAALLDGSGFIVTTEIGRRNNRSPMLQYTCN